MKEKKEYRDLVQYAVDQAKMTGADAAEAYISDSQKVEIFINNRTVESVNASKETGIGIRILKDHKIIFGSSNELFMNSIKGMVSDLMRKISFHTPDEFNVIYGKEYGVLKGDWSEYTNLVSYDPKITEVSVEQKIKRAIALEEAGLNYSSKVTGSMYAVYSDQVSFAYLANSNGISGRFPASGCGGAGQFSAAEGDDRQSGNKALAAVKYDDFDPFKVGQEAAQNAVRMLGAKSIKSCELPMVISPDVGVNLLGYIVGMLSADDVQKGKSLFAGKIGKIVASDAFNLIDDGKLKGGLATQPVDSEGVPRQTTPLIVNGVLKTYLYDCYNAKKGKTKSTGNRVRGSYQGTGGIGSTNLYLKAGATKSSEIFKNINDGFYLTEAFGLHAGINNVTGDFSIPVAGFKIENGEMTYPIRGVTIGGNLFEFLKSVEKVGDDLTWIQATCCPTFSVKNIKIGGA
jgi:PmbA protein